MIYNGEGDLYEIRNYRTGRASFFDYDHAGRCMASKERAFTVTNGRITYGANLSSYGYQYDECNNLSKLTCSVLGSKWSTVYTYDNDNRPSTTTLASGKVITNTYDAIGRLTNRALGLNTTYNTALTYVPGNDTNKTTGLVATYQNGSDAAYNYTYDDVGNITEITQGTTSIGYVYDDANRLIRENNQVTNQTIVYDYENELWGNIRSRKIYAYTTIATDQLLAQTPSSTVNYAYTNTAWGDQLTEYNGQTITYDDMGNPTTYRGYSMAWRGKQLVSASNGTDTLSFEYNEDGLRQKKTVNNVDTDYYYNGSVLIGMQRGTDNLLFSYDVSGNVVSVKYITANDTNEYYYLRNAQNDVVKLIDASGVTVVEYTYDTWGKKVTTTGSLAGTLGLFQPFRYRGYVYDWETGFYYLQSRYYDPTVGRFISADILLSTGQGVMGHNAYAYCLGNPINYEDPDGQASILSKIKELFEQLVYGGGGTGQSPWAGRDDTKYDEWQNPQDQIKSDPRIDNASSTSSNQSSAGELTLLSWQDAEQYIRDMYGGTPECFDTDFGRRYVDSYYVTAEGKKVIQEVKYGKQSLSLRIKCEIIKDKLLLLNGRVDSVEWHFFTSMKSSTLGGSKPLYDALTKAGFKMVFHQ